MDSLTSIKVLRQVVESGSFVRAAERLDVSTATVSKHVMNVEQRLRVRLLNRNSRSLSLTEAGRLYLGRCQTVLEELEAIEMELGSLGNAPRGTLRVSVSSSASGRCLAHLLAEYRRQYPEVLVELSFEDRFTGLVEEGYDLALRIASSQQSLPLGLIARPLRPAIFYLAASRAYLERRGVPESLDELAHHDFVAVGDTLNCGPPPAACRVVMRYSSMDGVTNAVAAGIGIAPILADVFEDPAFRGVLMPILPEQLIQKATLYAVYARQKFQPLKLRTFIDFIVKFFSQVPERNPCRLQSLQPASSSSAYLAQGALQVA